jgi:hypothetical protein
MRRVLIRSDRDKFEMVVAFQCPSRASSFVKGFTKTVCGIRNDEGIFTENGHIGEPWGDKFTQRGAAFVPKFCSYLDRHGLLYKRPIAEAIK